MWGGPWTAPGPLTRLNLTQTSEASVRLRAPEHTRLGVWPPRQTEPWRNPAAQQARQKGRLGHTVSNEFGYRTRYSAPEILPSGGEAPLRPTAVALFWPYKRHGLTPESKAGRLAVGRNDGRAKRHVRVDPGADISAIRRRAVQPGFDQLVRRRPRLRDSKQVTEVHHRISENRQAQRRAEYETPEAAVCRCAIQSRIRNPKAINPSGSIGRNIRAP